MQSYLVSAIGRRDYRPQSAGRGSSRPNVGYGAFMRPRRLKTILALLAGGLALLGLPGSPALAQGPSRQTASVLFSQPRPGASSGLQITIDYRNPNNPNDKPFAVHRVVTTLAPGSQIDTSVPAQCKLSDEQLTAGGSRGCPAGSVVGSGKVSLSSTNANPTTNTDVTLINNAGELIFLVETGTSPTTRMVIRAPMRGNTITSEVPELPGGPPDGATAIRTASLKIGATLAERGIRTLRRYITTPPTCPASNRFVNSAAFTYFDGVSQALQSASPCIDMAPPKVRLLGISRRSCASHDRARPRAGAGHLAAARRGRQAQRAPRQAQHQQELHGTAARRRLRRGVNRVTVLAVDRQRQPLHAHAPVLRLP